MSIEYSRSFSAEGFEDADHTMSLNFEGDVLRVTAGYDPNNTATITLEQFDEMARQVEVYREMRHIVAKSDLGRIEE